MFKALKFIWDLSAALGNFVVRIVWNFFLFIVALIAVGLGLYFAGDFVGTKRGKQSMAHHQVRADRLALQIGEYAEITNFANQQANAAEKKSAEYKANWTSEKNRRESVERQNGQLTAANATLVAEKSFDQQRILALEVLNFARHDTINDQREANTMLLAANNRHERTNKALLARAERTEEKLAKTQLIADRVIHSEDNLKRATQRQARANWLMVGALLLTGLNLFSRLSFSWLIPLASQLKTKITILARAFPFL